ncbi:MULTISPECIES: prepilin-type N-terminal cleavage/methylation domain-containing protein [unclassified Sporosarcina]|uniref:type IV pilus modification PilV family protein n=1 Tax=unclassified Sporosarcina TaxID=2647733 RepID=UPI000C16858E|nr:MULTISPECIES: prepilin-type N-terminal cleavage/methylation domain-containing protein [unclassified Sporosarcina]PID07331.1 hypothetical protein CSV66_01780 [Sporosarcina sp. P30]PID10527.1 hypothetical protein CSV65_01785 [Sporosarcina sp. P31]PID13112.1 hypothetical protein CSV64_04365 [Sporosarcina sp. P32b]
MFMHYVKKNSGMTLVEVLASLVLLSIIIISFLVVFPIVAKQNKASEEFMDATYIAQSEMEYIISIKGQEDGLTDLVNKLVESERVIKNEGRVRYKTVPSTSKEIVLEREIPELSHKVAIIFNKDMTYQTSHVLVKVSQLDQEEKLRAQMETILWWGEN